MSIFNEYPYTNFHEMNLDWIIKEIKKLHNDWDEFTIINKIRFYGAWDITKQYPAYAIVNADNGKFGYISTRPVPAGIDITNSHYWVMVANYDVLIGDLQNRVVELERSRSDKLLLDKKICIIGDRTINNTWPEMLREVYGAAEVNVHRDPDAEYGGTNSCDALTYLIEPDMDVIVICCGNVDYEHQNEIGKRNGTESTPGNLTIYDGLANVIAHTISLHPNAKIFACLPLTNREGIGTDGPVPGIKKDKSQKVYLEAFSTMYAHRGIALINLHDMPCFKPWMTIYNNLYAIDGAYPNDAYSPFMADKIAHCIANNTCEYVYCNNAVYDFVTDVESYLRPISTWSKYERAWVDTQTVQVNVRYRGFQLDVAANNRTKIFDKLPDRLQPENACALNGFAAINGINQYVPVTGGIGSIGCYISFEGVTPGTTITVSDLILEGCYPVTFESNN